MEGVASNSIPSWTTSPPDASVRLLSAVRASASLVARATSRLGVFPGPFPTESLLSRTLHPRILYAPRILSRVTDARYLKSVFIRRPTEEQIDQFSSARCEKRSKLAIKCTKRRTNVLEFEFSYFSIDFLEKKGKNERKRKFIPSSYDTRFSARALFQI